MKQIDQGPMLKSRIEMLTKSSLTAQTIANQTGNRQTTNNDKVIRWWRSRATPS